jgi:hypothetical protein
MKGRLAMSKACTQHTFAHPVGDGRGTHQYPKSATPHKGHVGGHDGGEQNIGR